MQLKKIGEDNHPMFRDIWVQGVEEMFIVPESMIFLEYSEKKKMVSRGRPELKYNCGVKKGGEFGKMPAVLLI